MLKLFRIPDKSIFIGLTLHATEQFFFVSLLANKYKQHRPYTFGFVHIIYKIFIPYSFKEKKMKGSSVNFFQINGRYLESEITIRGPKFKLSACNYE